jgi:hypothetical protein
MPVPSVSSTTSAAPCAAPARHSASAATLASLSTSTANPRRSAIRSRNGTSLSGRFTAIVAMPRRWSIRQGMPKPTVVTSCLVAARASSTASTAASSSSR